MASLMCPAFHLVRARHRPLSRRMGCAAAYAHVAIDTGTIDGEGRACLRGWLDRAGELARAEFTVLDPKGSPIPGQEVSDARGRLLGNGELTWAGAPILAGCVSKRPWGGRPRALRQHEDGLALGQALQLLMGVYRTVANGTVNDHARLGEETKPNGS